MNDETKIADYWSSSSSEYWRGLVFQVCLILEYFLAAIPGLVGMLLRRLYWSKKLTACSKHLVIGRHVEILYPNGKVTVGNNVFINAGTTITAKNGGEVHISSDVLISRNVTIRANARRYSRVDIPRNQQGYDSGIINIEDSSWIGTNTMSALI
jgi:acetyltransferase-like isoleucine patch superfamily enzyme